MSPRRILFVCIGNAYRSQMAEGFMRSFAGREFDVFSAGLSPASRLPRETITMMAEKGIDVSAQFPKSIEEVLRTHFDIIVNMSGAPLHGLPEVIDWQVDDPLGGDDHKFRRVRDEIEQRVQRLLVEVRHRTPPRTAEPPPPASPFRRRPERRWDPEGWRRGR